MAYSLKGIKRMLDKHFTQENIALTLEQYFVLNILDNEEGLILKELANIVDREVCCTQTYKWAGGKTLCCPCQRSKRQATKDSFSD
ncbi:MAG: hypothetical protein U5K69_18020 [Balneolaceae bacterium]|nr:hypothetical protein [Balneolaceae bacterium]